MAIEVIPRRRFRDKLGEIVRAAFQVGEVEDAFSQPPEEAGHAVFQHFAARTEHAGAGCEHRRERQQVVLVASRAVEQQERERRRVGAVRWLVDVIVAVELWHRVSPAKAGHYVLGYVAYSRT